MATLRRLLSFNQTVHLGSNKILKLEFNPHDFWIGVYWIHEFTGVWEIYICLIPCLPLKFSIW